MFVIIAVRLRFFLLRFGNKYVLYFSLEAAILWCIFQKMHHKIAASKKLLKATACRVPEITFVTLLIIKELILVREPSILIKNQLMPVKTSKILAICISNLFHPLLVLTYMLILSILINPYAFGVSQIGEGKTSLYLLSIFGSTVVLPAISILLMKNLDMIGSWDMKDRMDRIGPFLAAGMWYISLCYNFYQLPDMPILVKSAFVGVTIALFFAFFLNLFSKISIHAVGMGALIGFVLVSMLLSNYNSISICLLYTSPSPRDATLSRMPSSA